MKKKDFQILVVDDDLDYAETCAKAIIGGGYSAISVGSAGEAIEFISKERAPHLVITDLKMPKLDGLQLLDEIKSRGSAIEVIIMTGYGSIESAIKAIKEGATDYITKPFNRDELLNAIRKVYKVCKLKQEVEQLRQMVSDQLHLDGFIFKNKDMVRVYDRISSAARCDCSVFISGESGTGKELIAGAIHRNSSRYNGPFVAINCSAISSELIESEMFGHRKGAFTGANSDYDGLFVAADGGTLFLDEIAEMAIGTQAKLLRAIQEKSVRPVGSLEERKVDVRFVAATNTNVTDALSERKLREDLYHRLNVIQIDMPPLRKMRDEVMDIITYFIRVKSGDNNQVQFSFDIPAARKLAAYSWPGNIREAENLIDGLFAQNVSGVVGVKDLPKPVSRSYVNESNADDSIPSFSEAERDLIIRALRESNGNKSRAAEILGISRPRLYKKIDQFNIKNL